MNRKRPEDFFKLKKGQSIKNYYGITLKFLKKTLTSNILLSAIFFLFGISILLLNQLSNPFNPIPHYGQYSFEIGGDFVPEKDVINYMTFHYDFEKEEGIISFKSDSLNKNFKHFYIELPPDLKLNGTLKIDKDYDFSILDKSDEIMSKYIIEFSEPLNETVSILFGLRGEITPNGVYNFNTIPLSYGWTVRLFLRHYECQYSCITYYSEGMLYFIEDRPTGTELFIRTEEGSHNVRFLVNSLNKTNRLINSILNSIAGGLIVSGIVNFLINLKENLLWESLKRKVIEKLSKELFGVFVDIKMLCKVNSAFSVPDDSDESLKISMKNNFYRQLEELADKEKIEIEESWKEVIAKGDLGNIFKKREQFLSDVEHKYSRFLDPEITKSLMDIQENLRSLDLNINIKKKGRLWFRSDKEFYDTVSDRIHKIIKEIFKLYKLGINIYFD